MIKFVSLLLALCMVLVLAACGSETSTPSANQDSQSSNLPEGVPANVEEAESMGRTILVMNQHNSKESLNGQFTQAFVDYVNENSDTLYIDVYYNGELAAFRKPLRVS